MSIWLKQSTAVTVKLGPFVDSTDGATAETGLTISQADIRLSKNGGDIAQTNNAAGATHDELGYYDVPLDATDTGTLGSLKVMVSKAGALPVWAEFMVVPANVWDSCFGADNLQVDVTQICGAAQSAIDLKDFADTGYDPATHKIEACKANDDMRGTDNAALAATALTNATWTDARAAKLDNLDAAVSSRLATVDYTAPDNASIAAILSDTGTDGVVVAAGSKTGYELTAAYDAAKTAAQAGDAMTLTVAERASVADKLLGRSIAGSADGGRTVTSALRALRNKTAVVAGTLTVYQEDDTTADWTATATTDASADPIISVDPA